MDKSLQKLIVISKRIFFEWMINSVLFKILKSQKESSGKSKW
jgi:hypothetical protein